MEPIRIFPIVSWVLLPTVMFGGYSMLTLLARNNPWLTPKRMVTFRAGHAHAGVLLILSLVYYSYLAQTSFASPLKVSACVIYLVGVLAQSGGFFVDMLFGEPGRFKWGYLVTTVGAVLLAVAILLLAVGLVVSPA